MYDKAVPKLINDAFLIWKRLRVLQMPKFAKKFFRVLEHFTELSGASLGLWVHSNEVPGISHNLAQSLRLNVFSFVVPYLLCFRAGAISLKPQLPLTSRMNICTVIITFHCTQIHFSCSWSGHFLWLAILSYTCLNLFKSLLKSLFQKSTVAGQLWQLH